MLTRWRAKVGIPASLEPGRQNSSSGFTLVELMIVVIIIAALSVIAMPRFVNTKGQAYRATMQSDLHNLATAQEAYLVDWNSYYGGPLPNTSQIIFKPSLGVTVDMAGLVPFGWSAISTHTALTGLTCAIYMGAASPVAPAVSEGEIACQ